jgi:hypothetical protein
MFFGCTLRVTTGDHQSFDPALAVEKAISHHLGK